MKDSDTGILLHRKDIELHRKWFNQMTKLIGLNVLYRAPREESKQYDTWGELDTHYYEPIVVGCIYQEHPTQKTAKKMGWNAELSESSVLIVVPYDLPHLQQGSLFIIPSALDNSKGRVFKVIKMEVEAIYPCTVTCELGPVLGNKMEPNQVKDYSKSNHNVIIEETDLDEDDD